MLANIMELKKLSSRIDSLQMIRGFAAIAVILHHETQILTAKLDYTWLNELFLPGSLGVDIFFVLSGFIILHTSKFGQETTLQFLKKRAFRIYPIYIFFTVFMIAMAVVAPSEQSGYRLEISNIIGSLLLLPQKKYIVHVAWTLSYEVIFYIVFSLTYFKSPKYMHAFFVIWGVVILGFEFSNFETDSLILNTLLSPLIIEFYFGCLVAFLYKKIPYFKYGALAFWAGLVLLIAMPVLKEGPIADHIDRMSLLGIPSALLVLGSLYLKSTIPSLLVFFGDASYSIYLVHYTVLGFLLKLAEKFNLALYLHTLPGTIALFICTFLAGCFFYYFIERNLQKLLKPLFFGKKTNSTRVTVR